MQFILKIIPLLLFLSFSVLTSCGESKTSPKVKTEKTKKNNAKKGAKSAQKKGLSKLQKTLGITKVQERQIRNINAKFNKDVKQLKKANKWKGTKNKKTRELKIKEKADALKKVLGNKYEAYRKYQKKAAEQKRIAKKKKQATSKK